MSTAPESPESDRIFFYVSNRHTFSTVTYRTLCLMLLWRTRIGAREGAKKHTHRKHIKETDHVVSREHTPPTGGGCGCALLRQRTRTSRTWTEHTIHVHVPTPWGGPRSGMPRGQGRYGGAGLGRECSTRAPPARRTSARTWSVQAYHGCPFIADHEASACMRCRRSASTSAHADTALSARGDPLDPHGSERDPGCS